VCDHLLQQRQLRIYDAYNQSIVGYKLVGCCSTRAQVRHTAPVVFPVDFDDGEHIYRDHPLDFQLVTDPVIMSAKEEHVCDSGSDSLDKHERRDMLHDHVERRDQSFAVAERAER